MDQSITEEPSRKGVIGDDNLAADGLASDTDQLLPCRVCGRKFAGHSLVRHVPICERLACKPKRDVFRARTQRLAHVAQETLVRSLILEDNKKPGRERSARIRGAENPSRKPGAERPKSRARDVHAGIGLFREQQKDLLRCQICGRSFREEAYKRHVDFCKQQHAKHKSTGMSKDETANAALWSRRMMNRPSVAKSSSWERSVTGRNLFGGSSIAASRGSESSSAILSSNSERSRNLPDTRRMPGESIARDHAKINIEVGEQKSFKLGHAPAIERYGLPRSDQYEKDASGSDNSVSPDGVPLNLSGRPTREFPTYSRLNSGDFEDVRTNRNYLARLDDSVLKNESYKKPLIRKSVPTSEALRQCLSKTDSFLFPAVTRIPLPESDKQHFFQRVGGTYQAPVNQSYTRFASMMKDVAQNDENRKEKLMGLSLSESFETKLTVDRTFCNRETMADSVDMVVCHSCGKRFPVPEATFCCYCGERMQAGKEQKGSEPPKFTF